MKLPDYVFLLFLYLKLTGQVDWSWWWVTIPLWGGIVAAGLLESCGAAGWLRRRKAARRLEDAIHGC